MTTDDLGAYIESVPWQAGKADRAPMPQDPFVREKFTKERTAARKAIREYFKRYPNEKFQTEVESWRLLQSQNFEFTMKRLREPIGG
jgi:hypothetical protein